MVEAALKQKIQAHLVHLLYRQITLTLWAESIAAIGFTIALWGAINNELLLAWLISNLLICGLCRHLLVIAYHRYYAVHPQYQGTKIWQTLFAIGAFLSGISWGLIGSVLMVENDFAHQTFTVFLLIGITCAANAIYSPNRMTFILFLLPAFLPFTVWLFLQGSIFIILGTLALTYIVVMLVISFHAYHLIATSLALRFENIYLVDNLEKRRLQLEKSLALVRATLESTTDGVLVVDSKNNIEDFNQRFLEMWGIKANAVKNKDIQHFIYAVQNKLENSAAFIEKIIELSYNTEHASYDELLFKDGRIYERYSLPQRIGHQLVGRVWSFRDVSSRKAMQAKLFHQANFDALTGLPNRVLLLDRLQQAIAFANQTHTNIGVLFLDLDRFKLINDTLGHSFGDKLLVLIANRLGECVHENDTVAREGGDEFIIILNDLENEADIIAIAGSMLKCIRSTFIIEGHKINITVSFGISFYPKDGHDAELLIRNADIAMYHAKELGRNNFQFFTEDMNQKVLKRLLLENQLRDALEQNEFSVVYQPIVNLKTGKIVGLEALLRWQHPRLVSIPTPEFIEIAEETGVIIPIGEWVLRTACAQLKKLQAAGFPYLQVAVNLSGRQFKQSDFYEKINEILASTQLAPQALALELTESIIMDDVDKTIAQLNKLKKLGVSLVVDDFGTGYSSLNYLKRLPVDKLKIDRSFIQDVPHHSDDAAITSAIIALAGKLNLKVVAEGVETEQQLKFLMEHHCDEIQGFYFSEPLDAADCIAMLSKNRLEPFPSIIIDTTPIKR